MATPIDEIILDAMRNGTDGAAQAQDRTPSQHRYPRKLHALTARQIGQPSHREQHSADREGTGQRDPRGGGEGQPKIAGNCGQGNVGKRCVHGRDEIGSGEDPEDAPSPGKWSADGP